MTKKTTKKAGTEAGSFTALQKAEQEGTLTMEDKLRLLFQLQATDSQIDKIHLLRGELPLEVQDLEDDIKGLGTRMENLQKEIRDIEKDIAFRRIDADNARNMVLKYEGQQANVKNSREFDSLSKEIENQKLDAELAEKYIREFSTLLKDRKEALEHAKEAYEERLKDLEVKKKELDSIISETAKEEEVLLRKVEQIQSQIDARVLSAYHKVRNNARNGLAVVTVKRDACGGCFNKIPPQRQLDIKMSKKIIVCEYCGRILVDPAFEE
ncbi:MAG: putative zinc ribbon domain protein [Bacteroidetes bacterium ADurb.Bin037]|nr:MAG: putative zinc ribbon domain protein [Bacteroidetes bacterium ADurb.Bin037]